MVIQCPCRNKLHFDCSVKYKVFVLESVGLEGVGLDTEHCALQSTGLLLSHSYFGFLNSNRSPFMLDTSTLSWDGLAQRWIWEQSFVRPYLSVWGTPEGKTDGWF